MSSTLTMDLQKPAQPAKQKSTFAFKAVLAISILYYARPEDVIPGMAIIPWVKIAGGLAVLGLLFGLQRRTMKKLPIELKLLLLLYAHMLLTIPFAEWRGGAFTTVVMRFSKGVIVCLLVSMCVNRLSELKKLFWVQAAALAFMTFASVLAHRHGRMEGVLGGVFENPNDLAINIALNWPFCFAFFLLAKKGWKKALWAFGMFVMVIGVVLTYSRSGIIATILCVVMSLYQFGIKGRRMHLIALAGVVGVLLVIVAPFSGLSSKVWIARMESIFVDNVADSHDRGSKEARTELLKTSLHYMATRPIFGIGPGNFGSYSGYWRVAHNTYTELGAEAGLPALFLFLLILARAFINLKKISKSELYKTDKEVEIFTGALFASWGAYMLGAAFSDTQYELFPYFMVAYTTCFYHMACVLPQKLKQGAILGGMNGGKQRELNYGQPRKPEPLLSR